MNKKFLFIALISMSVLIAGCANKKTREVQTQSVSNVQIKEDITVKSQLSNRTIDNAKSNNLESSKSMTYELVPEIYTNKEVTINYPQIINLGDKNKQKSINEIIRNEALKVLNYYEKNTDDLSLKINYDIKHQDKNLLSIQYSGTGYSKGAAHPNNLFYTTNINLNSGTKIRLADLVKVDENFVKKFESSSYKSKEADPNESLQEAIKSIMQQFTTVDLIKSFNNADSLDNIGTENHSDTFIYFTRDSLGISVSISHALGDHAEFEMKYEDLENNINTQNEVWKYLVGH